MKRINKAIAVGTAAFVTAGLALAAPVQGVSTTEGANDLVDTIADNVDQTEVVMGSAADISDGRQAARIAATLVNQNYVQATQEDFQVTEIDAEGTAELERTTTATPEAEHRITDSVFTIEHEGSTVDENYETTEDDTVLKPAQLRDVLYQDEITVEVDDSDEDYRLEEEIEVLNHFVQYDESDEDPAEAGLYYGHDDFKWSFRFDGRGKGLPTNSSRYTDTIPTFEMLGQTYALSRTGLDDEEIELWEGSVTGSVDTATNPTLEMEGWTVTIHDMFEGDPDTAVVIVGFEGNEKTFNIDEGDGKELGEELHPDGEEITVYVEDVNWGKYGEEVYADLLLGKDALELTDNEGDAFPADERWEIESVDVAWGDTDTFDGFTLVYGNDDADDWLERGDFTGEAPYDEDDGLPINTPVTGPVTEHFALEFLGFGSASPIYTTDVDIDMNRGRIINAWWTDRAGVRNYFEPSRPRDAALEVENIDVGQGTLDVVNISEDQYTVVDNKVVYLNDFDVDNGEYEIEFLVNSDEGISLVDVVADNEWAEFKLDQGGDTLFFEAAVIEDDEDSVYINASHLNSENPNIGIGDPIFAAETGDQVLLDDPGHVYLANESGIVEDRYNTHYTNENISAAVVRDGPGQYTFSFYDHNEDDEGLKIGTDYNETEYVDYTDDVEVSDKQHILGTGLEIVDTGKQRATFILPELQRKALTRIGTPTEETDEGVITVGEGDEFNGWKVNSIDVTDAEAEVLNAEEFYMEKASIDAPENIAVTDTAAAAEYQIVVGGPAANTVAEGMEGADDLEAQGDAVIADDGNKLLVAGYSATDTATAADELITLLKT